MAVTKTNARVLRKGSRRITATLTFAASLLAASSHGCKGTLDAGHDNPPSPISVPVSVPPSESANALDASTPIPTTLPIDASVQSPLPIDAAPALVEAGIPPNPPEAAPAVDSGPRVDGPLPVDDRNPIVLVNDSPSDNWCGEFALLAASSERINLVGIVVNGSDYWSDLDANLGRWESLVEAARAGGLHNLPDIVVSSGSPLEVPTDNNIDATVPNDAAGARYIVDAANSFGTPELPLVVVNGGTLTDIADAYLLDPTISERMVAVSSMGWESDEGGAVMGGPNGELDKWAGHIVAQRLRFVQVSGFYEHVEDVPSTRAQELPDNPFGAWMADKIGEIISNPYAADQVALLALILPGFALDVRRVGYTGANPQGEARLEPRDDGCCWFVPATDGPRAADFLWEMLKSPDTFTQ